jgi:phosphoribosylformylglycinamidine (FGAM) synthase-like amidotransferase family enzyme
VAAEFPQLCEAETEAFGRLLDTPVQRLATIAHGDGNYVLDDASLVELERNGRVVFRYARGANPNGSVADIAGIVNETGNVLGLMPHPERATDKRLGSDDGARVFASILDAWRSHDAAG